MAKAPLRAVKPGDKPVARKSISKAADDGNRLELLVALRSRIAKAVESRETPPRDLAALSRRLLEVAKEIESIESQEVLDDVGEAAAVPDEAFGAG